MTFRKYRYAFGLGIKEAMAYRADFWIGLAGAAFPIIIQFFMWQALYAGKGTDMLFGRDHGQMLAYSISAAILWRLLRTGFEYEINEDIKNGGLSKYMVKPVGYLPYRFSCFLGQKTGTLAGGLLLLALALAGVGSLFHMAPVGISGVLLFFPALLGALALNFLIFFCVGMWAFWLSETGFLFEAARIIIVVLSGGIFPLEIFGTAMCRLLKLLPFAYAVGFPADVLTGAAAGPAIYAGFASQAVWTGLMFLISSVLWDRGSRKFIAAGG